ncbi:DUF1772 domain-containing protein [Streptomyces sp. NPDC058872]|uniref:anthrone oxygenase family protein n=1 Tax=Streptomyces sp. NPDC058872 TaxID=3346661 RepID=UPI00368CE4CD
MNHNPAHNPYTHTNPNSYPYASTPHGTHPGHTPPPTPAKTSLRTTLLLTSTLLMGLMAGLFFAFDVSVMPGLSDGDNRTYITAMQNINAEIDGNGLFGMAFVFALLLPIASAIIEFRKSNRKVAVWTAAAALAYFVVLLITFSVNIPLNNELAQLGNPAKVTDFSVVESFKTTWVATNIMRTLLCITALTALSRSLMLYGRATPHRA